jgi:N-acetylmuramoyl-L-alanine amidase
MSDKIIQRPTAHFDDRPSGAKPSFLVIHYTETKNLKDAEDYFLGRTAHPTGGRVSVHYMIDEDGTIVQYVDESKRAWHAGKSYWDGVSDLNGHSIGIELVNPGHKYGYRAFPLRQMDALRRLSKEIIARNDIPAHNVVAHSDIAPERKIDPGELFDWPLMAKHGIGVWPAAPSAEDLKKGDEYATDRTSLREAFTKVGYNPQADLDAVIRAFQRRFYPEAFRTPQSVGVPTREMGARLNWLVRNKP